MTVNRLLKNGRVELYPYNLKEESPSSVDFSDLNNITYLLYRVPLNYELPPSFGVDFSKLGEPIPIEVSVKVDNKGREYLNFELPAMTSDRYVLTVKHLTKTMTLILILQVFFMVEKRLLRQFQLMY